MFNATEQKTLESMARRRGFQTARDYMRSLVDGDAHQHGETAPFAEDDAIDPAESFRISWAQVQRGEVLTEGEFWDAVSEDE